MAFFQQAIKEGDTVLEVGGHVGYLSVFFDNLVGESGKVVVFEPGENNLKYIQANTLGLPSIEIVKSAVSNTDGTATFFEESLTGQNNSLVVDYKVFYKNRANAYSSAKYSRREVATVRLDTFCNERELSPNVIKIDIEGAELMALESGSQMFTKSKPLLMVEVTRQEKQVFDFLTGLGYQLFSPEGQQVLNAGDIDGNLCAIHPDKHHERLNGSKWESKCNLAESLGV
ncbi:MAG: FkbM family methyltransferase [Planctomycetes bacterium]|nr:FkbM family methyltransferase [Planctomycetota bacterium]